MQTFLIIVGAAMFLTGLAGLARRLRGPLIQDDGKPDEAEGEHFEVYERTLEQLDALGL